jgi:hypothetical protein
MNRRGYPLALFIAVGVAVEVAIGLATNQLALWIGVGLALGVAFAMVAYTSGKVTATEALIRADMTNRAVKLAYRFPRLFGHLSPLAAADCLRPIYAPDWQSSTPRGRPIRAELD